MAHTKIKSTPALASWTAADDTLRDIRALKHSMAEMDVEKNRRIDAIKDEYSKAALPLQNRVKRLEADIKEFVSAHRAELNGKSRRMNFGIVGYRLSSSVVVAANKMADVIAKLKGMGHHECIKTVETLDRKALGRCPVNVILDVGAYVKQTDEFYYDTDDDALADNGAV
ncbi:MAG: host-nuclease inhibitor Gam family protein [Ruthenibacterium sp.]